MNIPKLFSLVVLSSFVCLSCSGSDGNDKDCVLDTECEGTRVCRNGKCEFPEQLCGNGQIDPNETCDGDCPESCSDGDDCTSDVLSGSAEDCSADCIYTPITSCADGDGCCPPGCATANDNDCPDDGFALRLNAGLETGTSTFDGKEFKPLLAYITDGTAYNSNDGLGTSINGTLFDELYQTESYLLDSSTGATFTFHVDNGDYTAHLHFVDWVSSSVIGSRVFHVDMQEQRVISNLDIIAEVGKNTALVKSFDVSVSDSQLTLAIINVTGYPEIAAVEILRPGQPYLGEGVEDPLCGDGFVASDQEGCDDGNTAGGDGCSATCQIEQGWICTGEPSVCSKPPCGDGIVEDGLEACDDGNTVAGDGCSASCELEPGWTCSGEPSACSRDGNLAQEIYDDMHLAHEGHPYGLPSYYDFYQGPTVRSIGSGEIDFYVLVPWGQFYEEIGMSSSTNARVQIRNLRGYFLDKSDNTWKQIPYTQLVGVNYAGDYAGSPVTATDLRQEPEGISAKLSSGSTDAFHFYTERIDLHAIYEKDVFQLASHVFATYEARLILDDPQGVDDRDMARFVADVGFDVWRRIDSVWQPDYSQNHDLGISRFKFVTKEWRRFFMTTDISLSDLQQNPPPM